MWNICQGLLLFASSLPPCLLFFHILFSLPFFLPSFPFPFLLSVWCTFLSSWHYLCMLFLLSFIPSLPPCILYNFLTFFRPSFSRIFFLPGFRICCLASLPHHPPVTAACCSAWGASSASSQPPGSVDESLVMRVCLSVGSSPSPLTSFHSN